MHRLYGMLRGQPRCRAWAKPRVGTVLAGAGQERLRASLQVAESHRIGQEALSGHILRASVRPGALEGSGENCARRQPTQLLGACTQNRTVLANAPAHSTPEALCISFWEPRGRKAECPAHGRRQTLRLPSAGPGAVDGVVQHAGAELCSPRVTGSGLEVQHPLRDRRGGRRGCVRHAGAGRAADRCQRPGHRPGHQLNSRLCVHIMRRHFRAPSPPVLDTPWAQKAAKESVMAALAARLALWHLMPDAGPDT